MRRMYIVCYDIADRKRLRKVHQTMRDFGDPVQYSVFECQLTRTDLVRCRHALKEVIHHHQDQVLFVDCGPAAGRAERSLSTIGKPYAPIDLPCIVIDHIVERPKRVRANASR
jgi:CRISPR-associated protein Cas2